MEALTSKCLAISVLAIATTAAGWVTFCIGGPMVSAIFAAIWLLLSIALVVLSTTSALQCARGLEGVGRTTRALGAAFAAFMALGGLVAPYVLARLMWAVVSANEALEGLPLKALQLE